MKKSLIVILTVFVLTSAFFTACKKKAVNENFVLKIGYGGSLCEAALHIAQEKGYFAQEGLTVDLIKIASGAGFDALTSGQVDASFALLASIVQPLSNGLPAKITTGLHTGCDIVLVKPDSGIKKVQDLRGKRIGAPSMTGSPTIYAKRVLADNGVDIRMQTSEVEFVVYAVSDLPLILSNGGVDAIAMNEPTATIAANEYGYVALLDSAVDEPYLSQYCCVAYVSDRILKDHRDIAEKYTRAMQRAAEYVDGNQDEITVIQIEKNYVPGDPVVNAQVLKKFNYIPSVSGAYEAFGITAPQLQLIGMLSEDVDVQALQRNSFVFLEGLDDKFR